MNGHQTQVVVVLRYDDFGVDSDLELEKKVVSLLRKHNLCAVFGVVPFTCPDIQDEKQALSMHAVKADLLREGVADGTLEAALHGFCHEFRKLPNGDNTEFETRPLAVQSDLIKLGMDEVLRCADQSPSCFIPPFNSYDLNTVTALERAGIRCLSASMLGSAPTASSLLFFPQTCSLMQARAAIESARRDKDASALIMPLFHQFDFLENDPVRGRWTLTDFEDLLQWIAAQPDVRVRTVGQTMDEGHDLGVPRYTAQQRFLKASLHPWSARVPRIEPARLRLLDLRMSSRLRNIVLGRSLAFYSAAAVGACHLGLGLRGMGISRLPLLWIWLAACATWILVLSRRGGIYFRAMLASVALAAMGLGIGVP